MDDNNQLCILLCRLIACCAYDTRARTSCNQFLRQYSHNKPLPSILQFLNEVERLHCMVPSPEDSALSKITLEAVQARLRRIVDQAAGISVKKIGEFKLAPVDVTAPPSTCTCSVLRGVSGFTATPKAPSSLFDICASCTEGDDLNKGNLCERGRRKEICYLMSSWFGHRGFLPPSSILDDPLQSAIALFYNVQGGAPQSYFQPPPISHHPRPLPTVSASPPKYASSCSSSSTVPVSRDGIWTRLKRAWRVVRGKEDDMGRDTDIDD